MFRKRKALTNFAKCSDANVVPPAEFIVESLTDNPDFTDPTPKISAVDAVLTSYKTALLEASSKDRNKIALKRELRTQLNDLLQQLGVYVNNIANGDVVKILSAGYNVSKEPEPRHITVPEAPVVKPGNNPGTIVCKIKKVKNAKSYAYLLADAQIKDAVWMNFVSTRTSFTFTNLEPGKQYLVKVAAIGSNGQIEYSTTISQYAL